MTLVAVNLGLPKSGTTTLAKALRMAGLRVADHRIRGRNSDDPALKGLYVAEVLYRGYFETGDPGALIPDVTAISEMSMLRAQKSQWPQTDLALIRAIRAHHPGVKFLASRRDSFALSQSMLAWSNLGTNRLPAAAIPGMPAGYGATTRERQQWIDGHYETLATYFRGDADFLEYNIEDTEAPLQISRHLGRELPWWGRKNANPEREDA